jgi:hypothetical protein
MRAVCPKPRSPPLMSSDAVVARLSAGMLVVVRCADLARVSNVTCPLPASLDGPDPQPAPELFGELRRIVLLETGLPLVITALGGVGTAMLVMYVSAPREEWVLPEVGFFAGLGIGCWPRSPCPRSRCR